MNDRARYALKNLAIAAACFVTGTLGLSLHAVGGVATLLWAPSAIALAIVLLYGLRWLPGIVLGTILIVWARGYPFVAATIIVIADLCEVTLGYLVLRSVLGFRRELDRVRDVVALVEVCIGISLLSATISVTTLFAMGLVGPHRVTTLWSNWWWGHLSSDLIVAPALLTWARRSRSPQLRHAQAPKPFEAVALTVTVLLVVVLVLGHWLPAWLPVSNAPYYMVPMMLWAGVRFGPRGAALASLGACVTAIIAQSFGLGPFYRLFDLSSFIAISTISTLMLSALSVERVRAVERKGAIQIAALDGIITIDHRGHVVEFNPAAERMFLIREPEAIGKDLGSLVVPPRLRDAYHRGLRDYLRAAPGSAPGSRYRTTAWRALDNAEFPVEVSIARVPVEDELLITALIRDRSAEEAADAALREAHEELEHRVEARTAELVAANAELERHATLMHQAESLARLGSFDFDMEHQSLKWSDELYRIYGRDMRSFQPTLQSFLGTLHPEDRAAMEQRIERAIIDRKPLGFEERIVRPDGSLRILRTLARVFVDRDGKAVRMVGSCQDVTETREDDAVRTRLVQLVESSDDAIIGLSEAGAIETWNAAAAKMFGYEAREVIGKPCTLLVPDALHPRLFDLLEVVRSGEHVARYELQHRRSDGSLFAASATASAVIDSTGLVIAMSVVVRDVTSHKSSEAQLKASLREKDVLLRESHHRVKNNLQVIASLLNIQVSAEESEAARQGLIESQNRIHSMGLVHQLLYQSRDLAQIDAGEYLTKLVNRLIETYNIAPSRITVRVSSPPLLLDIDRAIPCGLIANELVTNALTHAFPDGRSGAIRVTVAQHGDLIQLTVADNGIGIPPEMRIEDVHTFGLRIAHTLTHQLGGTISLALEKGTVIRVEFPLTARQESGPVAARGPAQ